MVRASRAPPSERNVHGSIIRAASITENRWFDPKRPNHGAKQQKSSWSPAVSKARNDRRSRTKTKNSTHKKPKKGQGAGGGDNLDKPSEKRGNVDRLDRSLDAAAAGREKVKKKP